MVLSAALPTQDHRNPVYCNFVLHSGTRRGPRTEQMQLHQRPHARIWEPANAAPNAARLTPIIAGGRLRAVHACSVRLVQIAHATKRHFLIDVIGNIARAGRSAAAVFELINAARSAAAIFPNQSTRREAPRQFFRINQRGTKHRGDFFRSINE